MPIAITKAITTLDSVEQQFGVKRMEDMAFFPEWRSSFLLLSEFEQKELAKLRQRYFYQRSKGELLEITALLLLVSPLLALAGFYDPPFTVRAEESVVLWEQVWIVVVESKKTALSLWSALPQTLAYLHANPNPQRPSYGLMTNGDEFAFVKLSRSNGSWGSLYGLSRPFALLPAPQDFEIVLQILKHLSTATGDCS